MFGQWGDLGSIGAALSGAPGFGGGGASAAPWIPDPQMLDVGQALNGYTPLPGPVASPTNPVGAPQVPLPVSRPTSTGAAPGAPLDITPPGAAASAAAPAGKPMADRIAEALRGVKMPASPELQRISTPAAPRPTAAIKSGELMALMAQMGGGSPQGGLPFDLPATLGAAIRGK